MEDNGRLRKKQKPGTIVVKLRQIDRLASQSQSVADAVRSTGMTPFTYYPKTIIINATFLKAHRTDSSLRAKKGRCR